MGSAVHKANKRKLFLMLLLVAVAAAAYLTVYMACNLCRWQLGSTGRICGRS